MVVEPGEEMTISFSSVWHRYRPAFLCLNCSHSYLEGGRESCKEKEAERKYSFSWHKRPKKKPQNQTKTKQPLLPLQAPKMRGEAVGESSNVFPSSCFSLCLYRSWLNPSFPFLPVTNIVHFFTAFSFLCLKLSILYPSKKIKRLSCLSFPASLAFSSFIWHCFFLEYSPRETVYKVLWT